MSKPIKTNNSTAKTSTDTPFVTRPPERLSQNPFLTIYTAWLTPLLHLGLKRPLDSEDLADLPGHYSAERVRKRLNEEWKKRAPATKNLKNDFTNENTPHHSKDKAVSKNILFKTIFATFGRKSCTAALLLSSDFLDLLSPLMLGQLTKILRKENYFWPTFTTEYAAYEICLMIFCLQYWSMISSNMFYLMSKYMGLKVRTGLSGMIYEKSLKLSMSARQVR